jgi:peptidoglycan/xylan/chitin deacetylase (PgdA/CDA1 family)
MNISSTRSGGRGIVMFFWDYDTQWGADRSRLPGGPKDWGHLEFENTERLLELHARYDVPACFAVVGAAALPGARPYHDPAQIRRIHEMGHEIASHSFRHEWLPGLGRTALLETLGSSREALEQCVGGSVQTFVPPYNQPFDYPGGWSFSLSERREAGRNRTDVRRLCEALRETGYGFCRVAYRPALQRLAERLRGRRLDRPSPLETIRGITCVRLNTPGGFAAETRRQIQRAAEGGGIAVVYGHPHSLRSGNSQDERQLVPLLQQIAELRRKERIQVIVPRDLVSRGAQVELIGAGVSR